MGTKLMLKIIVFVGSIAGIVFFTFLLVGVLFMGASITNEGLVVFSFLLLMFFIINTITILRK